MTLPTPSPSPEKALPSAPEKKVTLIVAQPEILGNLIEAIENLTAPREAPAEKQGEDASGRATTTTAGETTVTSTGISPRDQAIANLPPQKKMQQDLQKHIQTEVWKLRREAVRLTTITRPGTAFHLNQIYEKIRRLNKLLSELFSASFEALKQLFIRAFVDHEPIL